MSLIDYSTASSSVDMGVPVAQATGSPSTDSLRDTWGAYVADFANWSAFWTLTFEQADRTHSVTATEAEFAWRRLIQTLNRDLYGNHYTRIVGHSYFSYARAFEQKPWGLLHMHALTDRRTNWALAHRYWQGERRPFHIGIVDIRKVDDVQTDARYLTKYITKGGDVTLFRQEKNKMPAFQPLWFSERLRAHSTE